MPSDETAECLVLHAAADHDWTSRFLDRLARSGIPAGTCPIGTGAGWQESFHRRLLDARAVLLVDNEPNVTAAIPRSQRIAARLVRSSGRKPVIDLVESGRAAAGRAAVVPRDFSDATFEQCLHDLAAMLDSPPPRPTPILVLTRTDEHFLAARQHLGGAGAEVERYRDQLLAWCPDGPAGSEAVVVNSPGTGGNPPAELLWPDLVLVQADVAPPGSAAGPGAVVLGAPAWSPLSAGPDAGIFMKAADQVVAGHAARSQEVDLGAPDEESSAARRPSAVFVPLPEAALLRRLKLRTAVVASAGAPPAETAAAVRALADALTSTVWRQEQSIVRLLGFGDRPTGTDNLRRTALVTVLAELLKRNSPVPTANADATGPTVVTLEGPWGSGKSSMLRMLEERLQDKSHGASLVASGRRLTVGDALWQLSRPVADRGDPGAWGRPFVVRFSPWSHHLDEEVWAGLSIAVQDKVTQLFPDANRRERYWFRRNLPHVDRRRLVLELRRRVVSPLFKLSWFALAVPILAQVVGQNKNAKLPFSLPWLGNTLSPPWILLAVGLILFVAGTVHTLRRWLFGYASTYLPPGLFDGPVLTGPLLTEPGGDAVLRDPLYRARAGQLALWQQNLREFAEDLGRAGQRLILFVDDLDRCSPKRTAAVFEAMNDLLSADYGRARFVMAVDTTVLAAHLKQSLAETGAAVTGDDPDIGWAFLRKLVQLPVIVPAIGTRARRELLGKLLGAAPAEAPEGSVDGGTFAGTGATADLPTLAEVERDPVFGEFFVDRLERRPASTVREIKRLLTVWQFYLRVLDQQDKDVPRPSPGGFEYVERARAVLVLAEIITRWPSLQSTLHRRTAGTPALTRLAAVAATDPKKWDECWWELKLPTEDAGRAMSAGLRELLTKYPGIEVAAVAERLL